MSNRSVPAKRRINKGTLKRTLKSLFHFYPALLTIALICIILNAVISSVPSIFMQNIFSLIEKADFSNGIPWEVFYQKIVPDMLILIGLYIFSFIIGAIDKQLMAVITQGYLKKIRQQMFDGMQDLPIRYFDTNNHGDIMSYYTNDVDTLRQMISQSLPNLLTSSVMVLTLFCIMIWYSVWLTLLVVAGIVVIVFVTKFVGGGAGKYFVAQQKATGQTEGFIEEMMNGQKVVKVFCHEEEAKADFDKVNEYLCEQSYRANRYANMLMPILGNFRKRTW